MNNIKELFVSKEIAIDLKAKGFNDPCIFYFLYNIQENRCSNIPMRDYKLFTYDWNSKESRISIPLYEQVINWLDKKYNILISICRDDDGYHSCKIKKWCDDIQDVYGYTALYDWNISINKQESLEVIIKETLKYI